MSPTILVVMGVSGSGKSTLGSALAARLGCPFADGDDFHTPDAIARMAAGRALDEADRMPWIARIGDWIDERLEAGESGVVACSALRRIHRERLVRGRPNLRIIHLVGRRALIASRLASRRGHFMPTSLLDSQIAALEPPDPDENAITVCADAPPEALVARVMAALTSLRAAKQGEID